MNKIHANKNYSPQDLYQRVKKIIIPTGNVKHSKTAVWNSDSFATFEEAQYYQFNNFDLCGIADDPWLSNGSGDGYSRWILWDKLKEMPDIYFNEYESDTASDTNSDPDNDIASDTNSDPDVYENIQEFYDRSLKKNS